MYFILIFHIVLCIITEDALSLISPENRQKTACANKLWLLPKNVIDLGTLLFCQLKPVVRTFKNTQNLKIVKKWVIPLVHDAIQLL